jgi:hypothetical protein
MHEIGLAFVEAYLATVVCVGDGQLEKTRHARR